MAFRRDAGQTGQKTGRPAKRDVWQPIKASAHQIKIKSTVDLVRLLQLE